MRQFLVLKYFVMQGVIILTSVCNLYHTCFKKLCQIIYMYLNSVQKWLQNLKQFQFCFSFELTFHCVIFMLLQSLEYTRVLGLRQKNKPSCVTYLQKTVDCSSHKTCHFYKGKYPYKKNNISTKVKIHIENFISTKIYIHIKTTFL